MCESERDDREGGNDNIEKRRRRPAGEPSKPISNTYRVVRLVMLPMLSGMVPVSWLPPRYLQQWVGGDASEGWNGDVRERER